MIDEANSAPDFQTKQKLTWKVQQEIHDNLTLMFPFIVQSRVTARHPNVHNDGFSIGHQEQWTPEDAWLE